MTQCHYKNTSQILLISDNIIKKNMRKLYTKHYKSKILNTKQLNFNNKIYIGFKIEDLEKIKFNKDLQIKTFNKNLIDFNLKGFSFINKNKLSKNTLQTI